MSQRPPLRSKPSRLPTLIVPIAVLVATGWGLDARAVGPDDDHPSAGGFHGAFTTPALHVEPSLETRPASMLLKDAELGSFFAKHSDRWEVRWDRRNDRPNLIQGAGVPVIPGRGNDLVGSDLGLEGNGSKSSAEPTLGEVETAVRAFLREHDVLRTGDFELVLDETTSAVSGRDRHFWTIELQQVHHGVPVDGANAFFRISHGNIVQFGAEKLAPVRVSTEPSITARRALADGLAQVGVDPESIEARTRELVLYPVMSRSEARGERYVGAAGGGYDHVLVWRFVVGPVGDDREHRLLVDAQSGEVLELVDLTMAAQVRGEILPTQGTDPLVDVGLPYVTVDVDGTDVVTDAEGNYSYDGGTATALLDGRYVAVNDACGEIALSDSSTGDLDFGGSADTNCTSPGVGGNGNTNAARTAFYHLTKINRKAATFLPTNTWLDDTLKAKVNRDATCSAYWSGGGSSGSVNFSREAGSCANAGEIVGLLLHEWGHGMTSKSGGFPPERGSSEAMADVFAFLETQSGCIGDGYRLNGSSCRTCSSDCSGVRDVAAVASDGVLTIARPDTVEADDGIDCDEWSCPFFKGSSPYQGPMGYQGHCEGQIASTAVWDLGQSLAGSWEPDDGWAALENLWYSSLYSVESAYQVTSGGQCNPSATVDGCGSGNWYTVLLAADDDDGDLSNGTPNGCRIWDAFEAHGIACGSRPACGSPEPQYGTAIADETERTRSLVHGFDAPVVAIGAPSFAGSEPGVMLISDVDMSGFGQRFSEWGYLDGTHNFESVGYLAVEAGASTFAGLQVDSGVSNFVSTAGWTTVSFGQSFASPPVVLATVASRLNGTTVVARVRNVGTSSFELRIQWEELMDVLGSPFPTSISETVHWIAIEQGAGTVDGKNVLVASSANTVTDSWSTLSFGGSYRDPIWLGGSQTFNGSDPAGVRYRNLSWTDVEVKMQEETSLDSETTHASEVIGYVVIGD